MYITVTIHNNIIQYTNKLIQIHYTKHIVHIQNAYTVHYTYIKVKHQRWSLHNIKLSFPDPAMNNGSWASVKLSKEVTNTSAGTAQI